MNKLTFKGFKLSEITVPKDRLSLEFEAVETIIKLLRWMYIT